jgi:serine/threonine protein kinase
VVPELEFDPFSEQELLAMNKPVPKSKTIQRMSKIGGGAFGTTYRKRVRNGAVHSDVSRFAVKVISADRMEDMLIEADDVRREATILGLLRHKHVIRYVGLIETDEELALVMELAEGGSLADLITITKMSASGQGVQMGEVLEMTGQMGSALDYVHGQGIVHRDVKADNILLAHTNGAGPLCVKLADFGMAAVLTTAAGSNLSSKGGTSHYFAPERGKDKAYGAKADMWALGCVLIELVTLTRLQRGLWNDDTEVVERRNHLLGQVKLRDESTGKLVEGLLQMDKSCRLSALGLKAACSALVSAHTTPHGRASSGQVPLVGAFDVVFDLADLPRKLNETGVHDILVEIYDIWEEHTGGDLETLDHLQQLHACLGRNLVVLKNPPMDIRKTLVQLASQEPVGTRLLREAEAALQGLQQEVIEWVNKPSVPLPCVMEIREHSESVLSVAVSPDGKWIASGSADKTVKVVERRTGRVKCTLTGHSNTVSSVAWNNDGTKLATGSRDETVMIWSLDSAGTFECQSTLTGQSYSVTSVAWNNDGSKLASGSSDNTVRIWSVSSAGTFECQSTLTGHSRPVTCVAWNNDGSKLASGSYDKSVKVWSVGSAGTFECESTLTGHSSL